MKKHMATIYLGLGANTGNAAEQITAAVELLREQVKISARAPIYLTRPFGLAAQPNFLNSAVVGATQLTPRELRTFVKQIEQRLGRTQTVRNGPREIDIDILLYDDAVIDEDGLVIPHRDLLRRDFVLQPVVDLDQWLHDPHSGELLVNVLDAIPTDDRYILAKLSGGKA